MTHFLVIVCTECGGYLIANNDQKSRTCPYCGFRITLPKAAHVATGETLHEITMKLKELKMKSVGKKDFLRKYD
ncbi:MAG: DUF1922 domain-containing protein [Candidatus Bathyarchaeota archaeon]